VGEGRNISNRHGFPPLGQLGRDPRVQMRLAPAQSADEAAPLIV
jgi:hypothetical protein